MNQCQFSGRLVKDVELRTTQTGKNVAQFTIAVDMGKDTNGNSRTQYVDLVAWEKRGETISKYFHKGDGITINDCEYQKYSYDAKDGSKRYAVNFVVKGFEFPLSKKANSGTTSGSAMNSFGNSIPMSEDIPF